ncbi:ATP synthase F1 subunit gamma [Mycoplasma sp. HU2014]|uniref:ATP synthase F1 subunit gamma n=1 Tax=Mycoplasma sp. HU2014 TaxID=1664275 RepID=UPI00067C5D08|nr:ATP synthase F1 subunit gamma [Mycoplasma sp. HU2014]KNG79301.1 F0F1 ATP synthase subunit gamma [Mycoplasma sp. HU2014]
MPNLSGLKAEISSVKNIGKITNAMQLVASAKLRKIGKRVVETHQYVTEVYTLFNNIITNSDKSIYLKDDEKSLKKTLWIVINSNLGLCGGYNSNVNKLVMENIKPNDQIYAIGSRAVSFYKARKVKIKKQKTDIDINFTNEQARLLGNDILSFYTSGEFDDIRLVYTKYINNVTYEPSILRLFPIIKINDDEKQNNNSKAKIVFEPSAEEILETAISLYLNSVLYGTIVESQVSEQASRRNAMENATNNGKGLEQTLSLKYNRERQGAITQEISEIVSGANAQPN